jgi:hypothetical protein
MKNKIATLLILFAAAFVDLNAQNITYSEIEKTDSKNVTFEIIGKFSNNFLVYKYIYGKHKISVYDNNMGIKQNAELDFISDRTDNIDFINYADNFLMVWQYQRKGVTYCKAAKMNGDAKLIGEVIVMDTTRTPAFSTNVYYSFKWSEDKKKLLMYKYYSKNDAFHVAIKIFDEQVKILDSTRRVFDYNSNRESFGDIQIDNEGGIVFTKLKENARAEYINSIEVNYKKINVDSILTVSLPLEKQLVQEPVVKIDNLNKNFILNTFSYKKNAGSVDGLLTAVISKQPFVLSKMAINIFSDTLIAKLSGKPDFRYAYENFFLKNIILKKDGGFLAVTEEYYKQRRFNNGLDDRFNNNFYGNGFSGYNTDYYYYNRGNYGYYRPFNQTSARDIVYNYDDIITFSLTKDLVLEWNAVINKTTSDVETDNFLSFANMNAGSEIHFLFLQKDNNKQILSDHALQPNGNLTRYATLKSREAGYNFMPKLARQTGAKQLIIPCVVRNNIAFAKIDF